MGLVRFALFALTCTGLLGAANWQRHGNSVSLDVAQTAGARAGRVEFEWISQSCFRFSRCFGASCAARPERKDRVDFTYTESAEGLSFQTDFLAVRWKSREKTVSVRAARSGVQLLQELPRRGAIFRSTAVANERLYGLGPRNTARLDLRGETVASTHALLISSAGYGQYFTLPSSPRFDLGHSHPAEIRVDGPGQQIEYFFYYGPTPKEILEEHLQNSAPVSPVSVSHVTVLPERFLPRYAHRVPAMPVSDTIHYLNHASMSGIPVSAVSNSGIDPVIADVLPVVYGVAGSGRRPLLPYLFTYLEEARDRGIPMFRPMAMQYPHDPKAASASDQFMLGDELLVSASNRIYLPQGIWTALGTNAIYKGRQYIGAQPGDRFVHNGAILPLAGDKNLLALHYFPRLGAEFFVSEPGVAPVTQAHAGPAGDQLRLQVESKVARRYEWVVHHVSEPVRVEPAVPLRYDTDKRNLHIELNAAADSDLILNITLKEPL